jgi:hypothetical protein
MSPDDLIQFSPACVLFLKDLNDVNTIMLVKYYNTNERKAK